MKYEKLLLEGLVGIIDTVVKVRKIIQIYLMKLKYNSSCCRFSVMWSSIPRKVHVNSIQMRLTCSKGGT